jgi:Transposase domain (DUF772)
LVDEILADMSREFDRLYATRGRPSIPPERLLRAQLLQIFYSIRSELLLIEQLDYNPAVSLVSVGLTMDDPVWDALALRSRLPRSSASISGLSLVLSDKTGVKGNHKENEMQYRAHAAEFWRLNKSCAQERHRHIREI